MPRAYDARAGARAVFDALIDARDKYGANRPILEDQDRNPLSYTDLIRASFALGRKIAAMTKPGEHVGAEGGIDCFGQAWLKRLGQDAPP